MYLTNIQNQLFSAALPLKPLTAWAGSACSVTVAVPPAPALAGLGVSSVGVTLTLPDGHTVAAAAVQVPGTPLWVATFAPDEFATAGHVAQGLMITVAGTDEHEVVRTWIVAKGDVDVMDGDAAPVSGGSYYAVKLRDEAPEDPVEGDAYVADGELSIYHDGEWVTIGGGVVVDATLTIQGAAADAKAVGDALRGGFTEWEFTGVPDGHSVEILRNGMFNSLTIRVDDWPPGVYDSVGVVQFVPNSKPNEALSMSVEGLLVGEERVDVTATRHLITPTKTSQLQNDGAPNGGGTPYATTAQIPTVPSAYTSTPAMDGVGAAGSSTAWAKGDHVHPSDTSKANITDLPYALVTPGKWEFSGDAIDSLNPRIVWVEAENKWVLTVDGGGGFDISVDGLGDESALSVDFYVDILQETITATRASLPGHLIDRAGNRVEVTGDTTLTLPAAVPGYLRDFLVRLEISSSSVPTITFAAPTGETIVYETDGDEFPVPDEAGDWLYSFTESCVAHKFAVSLKKVNTVVQGGA